MFRFSLKVNEKLNYFKFIFKLFFSHVFINTGTKNSYICLGVKIEMTKNQKNKDFRRIIAAVDGSKPSKHAALKAIDLAKDTHTEIEALYVVYEPNSVYPGFSGIYPDAVSLMKKEGNSILKEIKKMGSKKGVNVKTKLVVGYPDQEIIKEAHKNDLIVMGCKGHSALSNILMGNVCEKVMHHSTSPVMVIR